MSMNKRFSTITLSLIVSITTFAGGILTNTNQNIAFLRNPARDASIQIDAVYSNPAGLAFLKDGFHISFNGQSAFQTRTIISDFGLFEYTGSKTKEYEGKASAPFIPSLQAAYKKGNWTFSGSFAVTGGGGKATFDKGLASFDSKVMAKIYAESMGTITPDKYQINSSMTGRQYIYGLQLGATYKIFDYLSVFGGLRMNYVSNGYEGYLYADMPLPENNSKRLVEMKLDCDQTGWGVTPIIGVDFKMGKFNVGAKYELKTNLNVENKMKENSTGLADYDDGVNTPHDIPSLLTLGVSYEILPVLRASVGYHHFFDTHAKMANNKQDYLSGGTNEYLGGIEWDINKWVQISAGMQRTKYGLGDGFMSDLSFTTSSYSYGFGAGFNLAKDLKLNVAYFFTDYEDYTKVSENYNGTGQKGTDIFSRTNKVFGIGLDYRF